VFRLLIAGFMSTMIITDPNKSHRSSIFIIIGLCAYLCIALITYVPYLIYIDKMSQGDFVRLDPHPKALIVGVIFQRAAIIISPAAIFLGIRRMRILGKGFQNGFVVLIAVSMCVLFFIFNFYIYNKMNQIHKGFFETNVIPILEERLMKSDLTSKQRIGIERLLAKNIYVDQNRLISITDENANHSLFKPSDEDRAYKKSRDFVINSIFGARRAAKHQMILWITLLFLGICLGRFFPIRKSNG
jgi:hypothetical protein